GGRGTVRQIGAVRHHGDLFGRAAEANQRVAKRGGGDDDEIRLRPATAFVGPNLGQGLVVERGVAERELDRGQTVHLVDARVTVRPFEDGDAGPGVPKVAELEGAAGLAFF